MINLDSLAIEVTRRCNMNCPHCMRGKSENKNISKRILKTALQEVSEIGTLIFTGGEPSLNVKAIRDTLDICKYNDIYVDSFYVITNGKEVTDDFISVLLDWYDYITEYGGATYRCGVALSKDCFHEEINPDNERKLRELPFFTEDKFIDWNRTPPLRLGNAKKIGIKTKKPCRIVPSDISNYIYFDKDDCIVSDAVISLTVDGIFLIGCDYEYKEVLNYSIGSATDPEWYQSIL